MVVPLSCDSEFNYLQISSDCYEKKLNHFEKLTTPCLDSYPLCDKVSSSSCKPSISKKGISGKYKKRHPPTLQSEKWHNRFEELKTFIEVYGHCYVPNNYAENPKLARWVKKQRYHYNLLHQKKQSSMTYDRIQILEEIGFVWDPQNEAWQERVAELLDYKKEHGNCEVPAKYEPNIQLATWVKRQRRQYKLYVQNRPSNITKERIVELESYGFRWKIRNSKPTRKKSEKSIPKIEIITEPEISMPKSETATEKPNSDLQKNTASSSTEYFTMVDALSLTDVCEELCDDLILDEYSENLKLMATSVEATQSFDCELFVKSLDNLETKGASECSKIPDIDPFMSTLSDLSDIEALSDLDDLSDYENI